jgi:hypothetical protein
VCDASINASTHRTASRPGLSNREEAPEAIRVNDIRHTNHTPHVIRHNSPCGGVSKIHCVFHLLPNANARALATRAGTAACPAAAEDNDIAAVAGMTMDGGAGSKVTSTDTVLLPLLLPLLLLIEWRPILKTTSPSESTGPSTVMCDAAVYLPRKV